MRERNVLCLLVLGASIAVVQPKNAQKLQGKKKISLQRWVFFFKRIQKLFMMQKLEKS